MADRIVSGGVGSALTIYRHLLRQLKTAYPSYGGSGPREFVRNQIRTRFRQHRDERDPKRVSVLMQEANHQLKLLRGSSYKVYVSPSVSNKDGHSGAATRNAPSSNAASHERSNISPAASKPVFLGQSEAPSPKMQGFVSTAELNTNNNISRSAHTTSPITSTRQTMASPSNATAKTTPKPAPRQTANTFRPVQRNSSVEMPPIAPKTIFSHTFADAPHPKPLRARGDPLVTTSSVPFMTPAQIAVLQWNSGESVKPVKATALNSSASSEDSQDGILPGSFVSSLIENAKDTSSSQESGIQRR